MSSEGLPAVFGTAGMQRDRSWSEAKSINELLDILERHGCKILDSAQLYGDSEELLGEAGAGKRGFTIDTKWFGGWRPGTTTKENAVSSAKESLKKLGVDQVDIFYIHAPDKTVPFEETCEGVNEAYKAGMFKRFGLSNFDAKDVEKVYDVCKAKGFVLPTVYQGNYSAVARKQDTILFPTLRKLGMSFYAYSPIAGGFLVKDRKFIEGGQGRFDPNSMIGKIYATLYNKPEFLDALDEWGSIAEEAGCSKAELAYRWVAYHSLMKKKHGDAIIFGASSNAQVEQTLKSLKAGPLSDSVVKRIDHLWSGIENVADIDNYTATMGGA